MIPTAHSRTDMHCHSTASEESRLGIQRALGLPECATPPEEVYELAKRRGMEFVTITDHDTISGVLQLANRPDVFVSEELTASFAGEPQGVHVLCYGIISDDHDWLQANSGDVEACAEYLHGNEIACALAHPFYAVAAPLTPRHRRRLAELFPVWETRNGARASELNMPAAIYIETHGGTGIGGSDDHAGVDIGRTFTETPRAATPEEFLRQVRTGDARARGEQGSAAKWAHAAMALAARALGQGDSGPPPDPRVVFTMIERVMSQGAARQGPDASDLEPDDARSLLQAWLASVDLDLSPEELIAHLQSDEFSHADLARRARRVHERKLREAVNGVLAAAAARSGYGGAAFGLFEACVPAIPYAPAAAFLGKEKAKLAKSESEPRRVALIADGVGGMHGVTRTLGQIRDRGVPGFEVEVIGTDPNVDRRLPAVAEVDIPFYEGLKVGMPSVPGVVEALADGRYDVVHLTAPGPAGLAGALVGRMMDLPALGSWHTELGAYAKLRSGDETLRCGMDAALKAFYGQCELVLSPSPASDDSLRALGIPAERIGRWARGVDVEMFDPIHRDRDALEGEVSILYVGRLTREKGVDLLADAFLAARKRDPRLHLSLAGGGPEEAFLRERLGEHASFLGWLDGEELARAYASAEVFLFASRTDTYGQVIREAQASALPVVAVAEGGPLALIEDGRTGLLVPPDPDGLADAVIELAASPALGRRLAIAALNEVQGLSWESALRVLASAYLAVLGERPDQEVGEPEPRTFVGPGAFERAA